MAKYNTPISRRKAIEISGATSLALLSGCLGQSGSSGALGNSSNSGAGNQSKGSSGNSGSSSQVKWLTHFGSETETFKQIINKFEKNNDATVNMKQVPPDNLIQQFSTALGTPNAPHMWGKGPGPSELGKFVERGVTVNLNNHFDDKFFKNFTNMSSTSYKDGNILSWQSSAGAYHAIPIAVYGNLYWYNKDVLNDIGISESDVQSRTDVTWQEFLNMCQTAKDAGYTPIMMGGAGNMKNLGQWVGASLYKQVGVETMLNTLLGRNNRKLNEKPFVEAMRKYQMLYDKGYINEGVAAIERAQSVNLFWNGEAAFYFQGSYMPNQVDRMVGENAPGIHKKIGHFWHPYYPDSYKNGKNELYGYTGDVMALNSQAIKRQGNMEAAVAFFKHFFSKESQRAFFKSGGTPVARSDAWTNLNPEQKIQKKINDQINNAEKTYPAVPGSFLPRSREAFLAGVGDLFAGKDPQRIMNNVADAHQRDLENYT